MGGFRSLFRDGSEWAGRNKFVSLIVILGTVYVASYPFATPPVPTVKERLKKNQSNK